MKILIFGAGKSGTTALMYGIKQQLPNYHVIFEPAILGDIDYSQENLIVKSLKAPNWEKEKEYFANFDRKILLIRNPYDRLISYLLYKTYDGGGLSNDNLASKYIELLKRKTESPQSVPVLEIIDLFKRLTGNNVIKIFQEQYNQILALSKEGKYGFKILRYEDFVDGFVEELEDHLGIKLEDNSNIEVDKKHQRVTRTKKYGDWKNWFTEKDVDEFSNIFKEFNEEFNYNDKNIELDSAVIDPEHSYLYVIRIINEYRRLNYLPEYEDGQIKMGREGRVVDNAINFIKKKEWSKAEATMSRALKINPSLAGIYLIQGKMFIRQNKLQEAETAIAQALELNPALSSSAEEQLGRISARKRRQEKNQKAGKTNADATRSLVAVKTQEEQVIAPTHEVLSNAVKQQEGEEEIYSEIWQALNQTTIEALENQSEHCPKELDKKQVCQYFEQTSEYKFINLASLSKEDRQLIKSVGLSLTYLRFNLKKLITKDGVSEVGINDYKQIVVKRQILMVQERCIYAICPSTGRTLRSNCSLFYNNQLCFYRFVGNEVFYVISGPPKYYFLYFPNTEIIVDIGEGKKEKIQKSINQWKAYIIANWPGIMSYILKADQEKTAALVGLNPRSTAHAIGDDLSGLQMLSNTNHLKDIDKFIVISGSDYYGGIDEIFPEIGSDKVDKASGLEFRNQIIDNNYFCLRLTERFVRESLAKRVYQASLNKCSPTFLAEVEEAKKKHFPLLWVGFRLGKRTWISQVEGIANIINRLSENFPNIGVVFDGISSVDLYGSLVTKPKEKEGIKREKDTVSKIQSLLSEGIKVYDIIGFPMYEVLVWANAVDLYMAPFGGGLAKIVSIANKPGVVHTSRFALRQESTLIYSKSRENSAPIVLVPERYITDAPNDKFTAKSPINRSYDCDWRGIYEEVFKLASSLKRD